MGNSVNESPYKGSAQITREQFLFYEMRTTAKLMGEGLEENEIIDRIVEENLFQYPTEKSLRQMAKACVARLKGMGDEDLIGAVVSHQIRRWVGCYILYIAMKAATFKKTDCPKHKKPEQIKKR